MKRRDFIVRAATTVGASGILLGKNFAGASEAAADPAQPKGFPSRVPQLQPAVQNQRRFLYHASALGLAGEITQPFQEAIETQAPALLGITGGKASSRATNFQYKDILSFGAAYTQATGTFDQSAEAYITELSARVENLSVLGYVTADLVSVRLRSTFAKGARQPSIVPLDAQIVNLRAGGSPVSVNLDLATLSDLDTFDKVQSSIQNDASLRAALGFPPPSDVVLCSLANDVTSDGAPVQVQGNAVQIPRFGTLYLAEMLVQPKSREVCMMRINLGAPLTASSGPVSPGLGPPVTGQVSIATGSGNGQWYPP